MACNRKGCSCVVLGLFLIGVIMLSASFKTLTPLQAGLRVNGVTKQIDESDPVYTAGRYPLGFLYSFIDYPTTLQTVEFSQQSDDSGVLSAATRGGQIVELEISFQYRLQTTSLFQLYRTYEKNYHTRYVTVAAQLLREIATQYSTTEYYTLRESIAKVMHAKLNSGFQDYFAVVEHFQLMNVDLPAKTEQTIISKLDQKQQVLRKEEEKRAREVRETTNTLVADYTEQARVVEAEKTKEASLTTNQALANAITIRLEAEAEAYSMLKTQLNFTNDQLTKFLLLDYIRTSAGTDDSLAVDVSSALFTF